MNHLRIPLRVVFYKEDDQIVAHCLEFNLMGHGDANEAALESLAEAITLQIDASREYNNPSNLFSPADGKFLQMFAEGQTVAIGEVHFDLADFEIDNVDAREYTSERGGYAMA